MRRTVWKQRPEPRFALREVSAWELCRARQEALLLARDESELGLLMNACVLARALQRRGRPAFTGGEEVLKSLSEAQVRTLAERYLDQAADPPAAVNPGFDLARFEELRGA